MDAVQQTEVEHWQTAADKDKNAPTIVEGQCPLSAQKNQFWPFDKIGKHGLPPLCKH